ncbi:GerAB/ArcD/ProY family transporter [Metabacillus litoralis]|uniref:GerAB/ArcD/ProY family transporter n=1 Tax=Metabacillus litoralis TaxID=152268 RepID=A0A5C6W3N3_9BACI|nr:GerAB/ArcD/ProY family transporter [Metabacillus litoralis]TXC91503.1 GerAB/ArcD/ProY family transporter [Metabacillus litoralis]
MIKIAERFQVSHFLVFYLIHSLQFGIGVLGFQRIVAEKSGRDAWIAVILSGIMVHISLWMIYKILKNSNGNVITLHKELFGKWVGNTLSAILACYFTLVAITVLRTYIEIIEVWMFPDINVWLFSFMFLLLVYYIISGGFRVVTGISFFGIILPVYLFFTFLFPLQFSDLHNLLPVFNHSLKDLAISTKSMSLTVIGFEALLVFYPFIKNVDKSKKWAHMAVATSTIIYAVIMIITLIYFSEEQLQKNVWATLTMWKIVEMPFVERFEYIGIANWCLIILPNVCLTLWCASRCLKDSFKFNQKYTLIVILLIAFFTNSLSRTREQISLLNDIVGQVGFYLIIGYIPMLFMFTMITRKVKEKKA